MKKYLPYVFLVLYTLFCHFFVHIKVTTPTPYIIILMLKMIYLPVCLLMTLSLLLISLIVLIKVLIGGFL
ncbi:MAG: hypothetical protein ACTSPD_10410 [Promethearchaeota archaeon]